MTANGAERKLANVEEAAWHQLSGWRHLRDGGWRWRSSALA